MSPVITTKTVFFTMVHHPAKGLIRAGNAYPSAESAKEWVPFVRGAWKGLRVTVKPCTIELHDGKISEASKKILDEEFNLDT